MLRAVTTTDQAHLGTNPKSVRLTINIARCGARISGALATGAEIDLRVGELAEAEKQGGDTE